jgi:hypothetical protein
MPVCGLSKSLPMTGGLVPGQHARNRSSQAATQYCYMQSNNWQLWQFTLLALQGMTFNSLSPVQTGWPAAGTCGGITAINWKQLRMPLVGQHV